MKSRRCYSHLTFHLFLPETFSSLNFENAIYYNGMSAQDNKHKLINAITAPLGFFVLAE